MKSAARRLLAVASALCLGASALAQQSTFEFAGRAFSLGRARFVAEGVDQVLWSPDGADIAYTLKDPEDKGIRVGLFDLRKGSGKVVAYYGDNEKLEHLEWLNGGHKILLVSRRDVTDRSTPTEALTIRVADAEDARSEQLWSSEFPSDRHASVEIDPSPSLAHALITVQSGQEKNYYVLTLEAKAIVPSSDLAEAVKEGQERAGWSVHGTALFTAEDPAPARAGANPNAGARDVVSKNMTQLARASFAISDRSPLRSGDVALECMPTNGVLRTVHFPGLFQHTDPFNVLFAVKLQSDEVRLGSSTQTIQSAWLVPANKAQEPVGLLVCAQCEGAWQSPNGRAIAYKTEGLLLIKTIERR